MAFNETQQRIIESRLPLSYPGGAEDVATLEVNRRQLRFLLQAMDHFRATACPLQGQGDECALVVWAETGPTAAIERACADSCERWLDSLVTEKVPAVFSRPSRFA